MFKVLDVREYQIVGKAEYFKSHNNCNGGAVHVPQHSRIIVIAQDAVNNERVRFEFLAPYSYQFGDKRYYGGYQGDWNMLIPGDYFLLRKTDAQPEVVICSR